MHFNSSLSASTRLASSHLPCESDFAPGLAETWTVRAASTPGAAFLDERAGRDDEDEDEADGEDACECECECECMFVCAGAENVVMGMSGCAAAVTVADAAPFWGRARAPLLPDDEDEEDDDDDDDDATMAAALVGAPRRAMRSLFC